MSPKVFFYHNAADKFLAACRLLGKASAQGKRVTVFSDSNATLETLDRLLWTYDPTGFVPHCTADSPLASETPILLTSAPEHVLSNERLMNLGTEIPPDFDRLTTLIEVVGQNEEDRAPARNRFRFYKTQGCEIQSIDLSAPKET